MPAVNAALNGTSALLLTTGYLFIRQKKITAHKVCMVSALGTSTVFLISYLTYHYHVGSIRFAGRGAARILYFAILISHTILAVAILPLALVTVHRAMRGRFDRHVRIARWTLPIWLYVSVTGVIVYFMLYHLYPRL